MSAGVSRTPNGRYLPRALNVFQLGLGGVGQALVRQYLELGPRYPWLHYAALADRSGLCVIEEGWTAEDLRGALDTRATGRHLSHFAARLGERAHFFHAPAAGLPDLSPALSLFEEGDPVVVDLTAERSAYDALLQARKAGAHVVLCNKWALAELQERYDAFQSAGNGRIRCETTVGAALPVIGTLERLLAAGDDVTLIEAAISGTLGYVTTEIQRGVPFSEALREANRLGYTEPDPRDDLAGIDARRKALILARMLGQKMDMADVRVESLVPPGLEEVGLDEFWRRLPGSDALYVQRVAEVASRGNVLRFLARIDASGASVGLSEVALNSLAGSLSGTESLFVFHTRRYGDQPLAVRGRGAGADLTASGVFADIISLGGWL